MHAVCEVTSKMDCVAICHAKTVIDGIIQMLQHMTSNLCRPALRRTFSSVSVKNSKRAPRIISDPGYRTGTWNYSVAANGLEWVADRLGTALPSSHAFHIMPKSSAPNLLLELDRGASTGAKGSSCVGLVVKAATVATLQRGREGYNFNGLPLGLAQPSLLVRVCPAAGHVWLSKTDDLRVGNTKCYTDDALDIETAAHRLCEMVQHDGHLARFPKGQWVQLSSVSLVRRNRARGLLAQLLDCPIFRDLEFCAENADRPYNAILRGKHVLYRTSSTTTGSVIIAPKFNYERGGLRIEDDFDAVVIIMGDEATHFCSLKYVGILPKSVLDERGMLGADGVSGKNTLYVRRDVKFSGTMLQGLESYFLNIVDASPDEIADFVSEKLG